MRITAIFILLILTVALAAGCVSQDDRTLATPVPTPVDNPRVAYLAGNGNASDVIHLDKGMWIFDMNFEGQGSYEIYVTNDEFFVGDIRHGIGKYSGRQAFGAIEAGNYTVNVTAYGPWEISVLKPEMSSPKLPLSYEGTGDNVTDLFYLPAGNITFTTKNNGTNILGIWLFNEDGSYAFDRTGTYLINGTYFVPPPLGHRASDDVAVTVLINHSGYYLVDVMTGGGNWSFSIS